jgi:prepilin-type N-terminal cleavage/methylation domain-containing protein
VARPSRESGFTLVEVLLTVAILGIGLTVVVGGMMTSIKVSAEGSRSAQGQVAIRAFAEAVAGAAYASCATTYAATGFTPPPGWTASPPSVAYWTGSGFTASCGTDRGLQRVTVRLTADDGTVTSLSIAKRQP